MNGFLFLPAMALAGAAVAAGDEICDPGLLGSDRSPLAYQSRGDRCEGIYKLEVNSERIQLAGVVAVSSGFDSAAASDLELAWPAPPPELAGLEVRLEVRSLEPRFFYRMDATVSGGYFHWPLEILSHLNLTEDQLGFRAFLVHPRPPDPDFERIYLPLRIGQGSLPPRRAACRVRVVPEVRLEEVYVSVTPADLAGRSTGRPVLDRRPLELGYYPAQEPFDFELPGSFGVAGLGPGLYRVDLLLAATSGGAMSYRFLFFEEDIPS